MSLRIDRFEEHDVLAVAEIDRDAFAQTRPAEEHLREELARPWTKAWVARLEERTAGYLLSWHVADELHVLQVASANDLRRRGIGRALVEHAVAYAVTEHVRLVLLEVRRSNVAAIALYRRVGFIGNHVRRGYYSDGEDALEMLLELDPFTGARVPREDEVTLDA